jgi:flagellar export protein FliJ
MSKFKFKFSSISKIKERLKTKAQKELAEINLKIDSVNEFIERTKQEILDNKKMLSTGSYKASELHYYERHGVYLKGKLAKYKKQLDSFRLERQNKMNELVVKTKEQKMFDLLEQKHYENFKHQELKKENMLLDEIAIQKIGRK